MTFKLPLLLLLMFFPGNVWTLAYNKLQQKSAHNSYERAEEYPDMLLYDHVRSIEFDCWNDATAGQWKIYHALPTDRTTVNSLADGVKSLKQIHDLNPNHQPVTVWVDIKSSLDATHTAAQFDAAISALPLFTPTDLKGAYASIQAGAQAGWPDTDTTLNGKFIFVITANQDCASGCYGDTTEATANTRKAFISFGDMSTFTTSNYKVFYNLEYAHGSLGTTIYSNGFVSRVYQLPDPGIDTSAEWNAMAAYKIHHIATDQINYHEDTWSKTHNSYGWPFTSLDGTDVSTKVEFTNVISGYVKSGDIEGNYDDFAFRYKDESTTSQTVTWTSQIVGSHSHVDSDWAKGCLMARQYVSGDVNNYEGAPYCAICRPDGDHFSKLQYRKTKNGGTTSVDFTSAVDGIDDQGRSFLKLVVTYDGTSTSCSGYIATATTDWVQVGTTQTYTGMNLRYQGMAISSHDHTGVDQDGVCGASGPCAKHVFQNLQRNGASVTLSTFPSQVLIGNGAYTQSWKTGY